MKKHQIFFLIALMFITVFVFYPALSADFVNLDDRGMVTDNWKIYSLSAENLKSLLLEPHLKMYHPLVNISYAAEYHFFGNDPYFYHADNLIIHLFNTLLVFFIFFLLTKNNFIISFITAFIFACHPVHVEPVAWISGRKDVLYAFFFLGSWLMYLKTHAAAGRRYILTLAAALFLFLCACLSKTMAVTLPAVLVLSDWFYGKKFDKKTLLGYAPFILLAVVFALSTYALYYTPSQKSDLTAYTLFVNFVSAHFNALFYIVKFLFPVKLSAIYPSFYDINSYPPQYILYSPALLYGIIVLIIYSLKKTKVIFFGSALFIIAVIPVINILPTGISPVADRYAYIPFIGFGYIAASAAFYLYGRANKVFFKTAAAAAVSVVLALMCFIAYSKAAKWTNSMTLFDDIIANYPGQVARAYAVRGIELTAKNRIKDAQRDLEEALYLKPNENVALHTLGRIRVLQKKYDDALYLFALLPFDDYNIDSVYMYSAQIYYEKKFKEKAYRIINNGIKRFPKVFYFYDILADFYAYDKNYDKAVQTIKESKLLNPGNKDSYIRLAQIYDILGKYTLVEKEYLGAIANCGADMELLHRLGEFYLGFREYYKAKEVFLQAVQKYPNDYKSFYFLGLIESLSENRQKALYYYTLCVSVNNVYAPAYFHRAAVFLNLKNYDKSSYDARKAAALGYAVPQDFIKDLKEQGGIIL